MISENAQRYFIVAGFQPKNAFCSSDLTLSYDIWSGTERPEELLSSYDPNLLSWIHIIRTKFISFSDELSCPATSYSMCKNCLFYPEGCGTAFVYLRTFIHSDGEVRFKVGVSSEPLRPLVQSSPFAILTPSIPRRDALLIERTIAETSKKVVMSPVGRASWAYAIRGGYWNGSKEAVSLIEFLPELYEKLRKLNDKAYSLLDNPILYVPTKRFSSELPSWIELLQIRELKRMIVREPPIALGEVVANRGFLLLLEYGDSFWVFEPREKTYYLAQKIVGFKIGSSGHLKALKLKLK